ncbi:hypothetical protein QVD17_03258 [Tagetes erecta]|uniref:Uncharacterized protein n=1 Tax=Tagetes erecta TaxID=13708 RepID=A0AAD8L9P0_TARER|nr:hypothetical protein QVD17_03258 [Tagetes erecta]
MFLQFLIISCLSYGNYTQDVGSLRFSLLSELVQLLHMHALASSAIFFLNYLSFSTQISPIPYWLITRTSGFLNAFTTFGKSNHLVFLLFLQLRHTTCLPFDLA